MKIAWLSGWAVPPQWVEEAANKYFPAHEHRAFLPTRANAAALAEQADRFDALAGYSLGALLCLQNPSLLLGFKKICLFAPFAAFCAENQLGGRMRRAQLLFLKRWLRRDPDEALRDFYARAGLPIFAQTRRPPSDVLAEGIECLLCLRGETPDLPHVKAFAGTCDPLLDAEFLKRRWPALQTIKDANHSLIDLCEKIKKDPFC